MNKNDFLNRLIYKKDEETIFLENIQNQLETKEINKEMVYDLTKGLSITQKQKLLDLYNNQISNLKSDLNNYKNRIVKLRNSNGI